MYSYIVVTVYLLVLCVYDTILFRYGPLVRQWTMRYEAKHNYFKSLARSIGNYINIAWTVALRHQQWQCYKWIDDQALGQDLPHIGPGIYMCHNIYICMK